mmetsp:Transcript_72280/g.174473  ORF Transcript_72280/g.174473 Transcript_72280/m.174473 type:complete len:227 (+) Transcript_72280:420-1100(+)
MELIRCWKLSWVTPPSKNTCDLARELGSRSMVASVSLHPRASSAHAIGRSTSSNMFSSSNPAMLLWSCTNTLGCASSASARSMVFHASVSLYLRDFIGLTPICLSYQSSTKVQFAGSCRALTKPPSSFASGPSACPLSCVIMSRPPVFAMCKNHSTPHCIGSGFAGMPVHAHETSCLGATSSVGSGGIRKLSSGSKLASPSSLSSAEASCSPALTFNATWCFEGGS